MYTPYSLKASHEKWEEALSALLEGRAAGPQAHRTQAASLTSNQPCPFHLRIQSAGFQPRLHPELALRLSPKSHPQPVGPHSIQEGDLCELLHAGSHASGEWQPAGDRAGHIYPSASTPSLPRTFMAFQTTVHVGKAPFTAPAATEANCHGGCSTPQRSCSQ